MHVSLIKCIIHIYVGYQPLGNDLHNQNLYMASRFLVNISFFCIFSEIIVFSISQKIVLYYDKLYIKSVRIPNASKTCNA